MNFSGDLIQLGAHDISLLKQRVLAFTEADWLAEADRQKEFAVHRYTQTIRLVTNDGSKNATPVLLPRYPEFSALLEPVFTRVADYFTRARESGSLSDGEGRGYPINVLLVKLLPGGEINPHMDTGFPLTHAHRIHIPLLTNDEVRFSVGQSDAHMREGEIWEINNRRLHAVSNLTEHERIHLIMDWRIVDQSCCCGARAHPGIPCTLENCESGPYTCSCYA